MKRAFLSLLAGFTLLCQAVSGQIVTTEPLFFGDTDSVTIIYDATQGTSALQGVSSVYMHSGVITSGPTGTGWNFVIGNWGQADGVGEMTPVPGETDLWQITILPRDYYGVPEGTSIYRLGMVFREGGPCSSCREGKSESNGDIFVDLYQGGLEALIQTPTQNPVVLDENEVVTFSGVFSASADYVLDFGDGTTVSGTDTTGFSADHSYASNGAYTVTLSVENLSDSTGVTLQAIVRGQSPVADLPANVTKGINYWPGTDSVTLVLWAPNKASAYVLGDFNDWQLSASSIMNQTPDGELFWITVQGLESGVEYAYQYLVDETIRIGDPYSDKVLDPDDRWIPESIYPNLKAYPAGAESPVWYYNRASVLELDRPTYEWQTTDYVRPNQEHLVVYELLIRDFLGENEGTYSALIDTLDYIANLGVNAIELMPVMEFNGNDSWGYNPTFMFAPDKYYGTREGLKAFIDTCHARGIAVILDMVMNQNDIPAPFLSMYWDGSPAADNPWFNREARHPFNVFSDINHESVRTQEWLDSINAFWLEEYRFDGYRFDLSKGFTQTQYGDDVGAWSSYDAGRVAILKRMADKIWEVDPEAYVILEHFAANNEETELANYGMMLWGNLHYEYKEAAIGYAADRTLAWVSAEERGWNNLHLVSYMESHDEQRQMYDALANGASNGDYNIQDTATALDRQKLAAAFFFPVPGPKMLWQFGEFGYEIDIDFNGRTGRKPTRWELLDSEPHRQLKGVYETLITLKTQHPAFTEGTFDWSPAGNFKTWTIDHESGLWFAMGNFGLTEQTLITSFPAAGQWYDLFAGDSIELSRATVAVTLAPGEFHIFSQEEVPAAAEGLVAESWTLADQYPVVVSGLGQENFDEHWSLYPNPTQDQVTLRRRSGAGNPVQIEIFDIFGAKTHTFAAEAAGSQGSIVLDVNSLERGIYIVRITEGNRAYATRFLKQ